MALNVTMIVNSELARMWQDAVVTKFEEVGHEKNLIEGSRNLPSQVRHLTVTPLRYTNIAPLASV